MARVTTYIALGSNMHEPPKQLQQALCRLQHLRDSKLVSTSSFYRSKALGPGDQADYLNAVCRIDTGLEAETLLEVLQAIENDQGRVREIRWGARSLDLDILLYGDQGFATPELQIPHPRMLERNFVLYPLHEIAPDLVFSEAMGLPRQVALASLLARVGDANLKRLKASGDYLE